ncbi:hypothetical protein AFLA_003541 [Aspergillus flavus NRRL3357]|nr:hypothetical protein AFLA_003541 [Aspergillus flavus NRRL3357]
MQKENTRVPLVAIKWRQSELQLKQLLERWLLAFQLPVEVQTIVGLLDKCDNVGKSQPGYPIADYPELIRDRESQRQHSYPVTETANSKREIEERIGNTEGFCEMLPLIELRYELMRRRPKPMRDVKKRKRMSCPVVVDRPLSKRDFNCVNDS